MKNSKKYQHIFFLFIVFCLTFSFTNNHQADKNIPTEGIEATDVEAQTTFYFDSPTVTVTAKKMKPFIESP